MRWRMAERLLAICSDMAEDKTPLRPRPQDAISAQCERRTFDDTAEHTPYGDKEPRAEIPEQNQESG
ncbi:hypothetical protein GWA01_02440 [Gluconobacter wancherniae NBRC 103581]|uniref:Uncharacterized protein n=1 Tax=Gluconobacter wancherniae NBRC 103581 TaxID=656744 RepID=A0A511AWD8_9PROT|nr:hypothetical protein GWA01_02440 [Gluconobacter wancherniae NBRC 103581]